MPPPPILSLFIQDLVGNPSALSPPCAPKALQNFLSYDLGLGVGSSYPVPPPSVLQEEWFPLMWIFIFLELTVLFDFVGKNAVVERS